MHCSYCGVELEADMKVCPLCDTPVGERIEHVSGIEDRPRSYSMSAPQKKFTWEIVSLILLSGAVATFVVDYVVSSGISWSEYPVAICLAVFSYVSVFAFWHQPVALKMAGSLVFASICMFLLDVVTAGADWSLVAGIPLMFVGSLVVTIMILIVRGTEEKGVNLIAYAFMFAALLCLATDLILSYYSTRNFTITWSAIAAICTVPVVIVLLFSHYRMRKGRSLKKTFHI